jgi:hypothetical protein
MYGIFDFFILHMSRKLVTIVLVINRHRRRQLRRGILVFSVYIPF